MMEQNRAKNALKKNNLTKTQLAAKHFVKDNKIDEVPEELEGNSKGNSDRMINRHRRRNILARNDNDENDCDV